MHTHKKRYLRISLTKEVKDLHSENYRTLTKKSKRTQRNGKVFYVNRLEEQTWLKCLYYPKQSTHLMQSLSKYHQYFLQRANNPKICMVPQKTPNSQIDPEKEKQHWRHHDSRFQVTLQSYNHHDSMVLAQKLTEINGTE